ncbi:hypothetical protein [Facilibium subflavum]|uniref:hypothetical protein n=1 Tax=Facilibium subflavum TaxID=2219058 RepID=UPI000E64C4EF|nr:hypothetical protein [Facilibium subflavum]
MKIKNINYKKMLAGLALFGISISLSYAGDSGGATSLVHNFKDWAQGIMSFISQIEYFIQIIATLVGMWFVFSALQLFRKHHTTQGAQGEHVKHGSGHLLLGVFLICLVPGIQMMQATFSKHMGIDGSSPTFKIDSNSLTPDS